MIRLEQIHVKDADTFVPQQFLDKLNREIEKQWNKLREIGVLKVECERHWPIDAGKDLVQLPLSQKTTTHVWYENKCGGCGETIFPSGWEKVT